jgi:hypothetical protein
MSTRKKRVPGRKVARRTKRTSMKTTKQDSQRRDAAAFGFFQKNPEASVAELNKAFADGSLTGKKEKTLNIKKGYALRKKARTSIEVPKPPTLPTASAARRVEPLAGVVRPPIQEETLPFSAAAVAALQTIVAELPKTNLEGVLVKRDGSLVLQERFVTERTVSLASA